MRSTHDILVSHLNHNFKYDSHIPLPSDYIIEQDLPLMDIGKWINERIFDYDVFKQFHLVNNLKKDRYKNKRRQYIFVVGLHDHSLNNFKLEKLFRPKYQEGIIQTNRLQLIKDYFSLRNAVTLIAALKKENVHREVYLLKSSFTHLERHYRFLMSSHINKFKTSMCMPPENLEHHSGHAFVQYYPNEIIPGKLFLGDANHATQEYVVRNLKLTHIANITNCVPRAFEAEAS